MARVTRWKRATTSARWTTGVVTWKIHDLSRETASTFCAIPLNTYSNTYSNSIRGSITSLVGTLQGRLSTRWKRIVNLFHGVCNVRTRVCSRVEFTRANDRGIPWIPRFPEKESGVRIPFYDALASTSIPGWQTSECLATSTCFWRFAPLSFERYTKKKR